MSEQAQALIDMHAVIALLPKDEQVHVRKVADLVREVGMHAALIALALVSTELAAMVAAEGRLT